MHCVHAAVLTNCVRFVIFLRGLAFFRELKKKKKVGEQTEVVKEEKTEELVYFSIYVHVMNFLKISDYLSNYQISANCS